MAWHPEEKSINQRRCSCVLVLHVYAWAVLEPAGVNWGRNRTSLSPAHSALSFILTSLSPTHTCIQAFTIRVSRSRNVQSY